MIDLYANPELAAAERGKARAADANADLLAWVRACMAALYLVRVMRHGDDAYCTADDARNYLDAAFIVGKFARPKSMNFMGSVFRGWRKTGKRIKSKTPGSHGNELDCWAMKE